MKHYVYKIEDIKSGEFYYGSRTCHCNIETDDYMGSMKIWKPNKKNLQKIIIKSDFKTRKDALLYERKLVTENINHPLNRNYSIPNTGFYYGGEPETNPNYGKVHTDEWKSEQSKRMVEYYKVYKPSNLGKKFDESWRKNLSESRIKNGVAKGSKNPNSYGNVKVTDTNGNSVIFDTAKEAAKYYNVDGYTFIEHCKNKTPYQRGSIAGFILEFVETD